MGLGLGLGLDKPKGLIYFQNQFSMEFDGVDDRIITDGADTVIQDTTYSFWSKSSTASENKGVFGHGGTNIGGFHFNYSSNRPMLYLSTNNYIFWNDTSAQDDGEWHHWVVYADTTNITNCKLYCDGVLQTVNQTFNTPITPYTESLTIGGDKAVGGNYFEGKIDEFAVFDRELTQAEITRMYNTYYTNNLVQNGSFEEIGGEEVTNGDFSQIGNEEVTNGDFSQIGSEEVTNGDFATDSDWNGTNTNGVTISNGTLNFSDTTISHNVTQANVVIIGKNYKITVTVSNYVKGSVLFVLGAGGVTETLSADGTYTFYGVASLNTTFYIQARGASGTTLSIDNVSVKEVGQDWTSWGTGWNVGNNVATANTSGNTNAFYQEGLTNDKFYKATFTVSSVSAGGVRINVGGGGSHGIGIERTVAGTYTEYLQSDGTKLYIQGRNSFVGSITNISIKEVGQDWSFGAGWGMGDGKAVCDNSGSGSRDLRQNGISTSGKTYKITFEADVTSGIVYLIFGGTTSITTSGTYTFYKTATGADFQLRNSSGNFIGSIDNISVKEVGQHWTFGTGWSTDGTKAIGNITTFVNLVSNASVTSGKTYKVDFTILDYISGSLDARIGGTTGTSVTANGTYSQSIVAGSSDTQAMFRTGAFVGSIDNVVVQELKHQATNLLVNSGDYQSANPLITSTKSMEFDGSDDYLQLSEPFSHTNHTITGWFKTDVDNATQLIFDAADNNNDGIRVWFDSSSILRYRIGDGSASTLSSGTLVADKWYNFACTYDGATQTMYIDGVSVISQGASRIISTTTNATIGKGSYTNALYFDGNITEVGAYNRALTSLEVASLYNQGMPTDLLVNRNNYQSGNPTVFNTKQVDFDGTDDYLETNKSDFLGTSDFTISGWIKPEDITGNYLLGQSEDTNNRWYVRITSSSKLQFYSNSGGVEQVGVASSTTISNNEWVHFVITADRGANTIVYVNGIANNTSTNVNTSTLTNTGTFRIGSYQFANAYWNGQISQIGIWNSTLTADEVSSLYNHGLPIDLTTDQAAYESSSNLVGYWRMGSGTNDGFPVISDQLSPSIAHISTTNLLTYSEDFSNASWTRVGSSVTPNATTSPDGTINADKLVEDMSTGGHQIQSITSASNSTIYTTSVFVKYAGREWIRFTDAQSSNRIHFNTLTGVFGTISGTVIDYNKTALENGWYKLSITTTSVATAYTPRIALAEADNDVSYTGDGVSGVYIYGAQLEAHPIATPYVKSNGIPGQRKSSTTNLITYSEDFGSWHTANNVTITQDTTETTDPLGTNKADKILVSSASSPKRIFEVITTVSGNVYTGSVYAKKGTTDFVRLLTTSTIYDVTFDLTNLTVAESIGYGKIESVGNGWYRLQATGTSSLTTEVPQIQLSETASVNEYLYLWGSQFEQQTQVTPYIKTIGSPVTVEFYKENNYAEMVNLGGGDDFSDGIKNGSPYANIVQDSDFTLTGTQAQNTTGAYWITGAGWSIENGIATQSSGNGQLSQTGILIADKTYSVTVVIDSINAGGELTVALGSQSTGLTFTESGTKTGVAKANEILYLLGNATFSGSISSITVEEVNTGLQGYWKMGSGTLDSYPLIADQTNATLGSELVTNGNFANGSTNWVTTPTGVTFSGGFANFTSGQDTYIIQTFLTVGKTYKISVDYNVTSISDGYFGTNGTSISNVLLAGLTGSGTLTSYIIAGQTSLIFRSSTFNGTITNVSVKQVQGNPAYMIAMPEGNITNQYPLTKLRNYYRMGDGILDSKFLSYPTDPNTDAPYIFQDQTSPNLAHIPTTNLLTYSEDFSTYTPEGGIVVEGNQTDPNGNNTAYKLSNFSANNSRLDGNTSSTAVNGVTYTYSAYYKGSGTIRINCGTSTGVGGSSEKDIILTNEWTRQQVTFTASSPTGVVKTHAAITRTPNNDAIVYLAFAQVEQGSYPTSYIKTQGATVTRNADLYEKTGISDKINSEEGVLFVESSVLSNDGTYKAFSLSDGTTSNTIRFYTTPTLNQLAIRVTVSGSHEFNVIFTLTDLTVLNKMALKYKSNDFAFWVNGVEVKTSTSGNTYTANTLNSLRFDRGDGVDTFFGKVKQLQVFKTALSDSELATLTTI